MKYVRWWRYIYTSNHFLSLSLSAVVVWLLITTECDCSNFENLRCLSIVQFPIHGFLRFKGHFLLNLVCANKSEDISAIAQGSPPGILYCKEGYPNKEIGRLRIPQCLPLNQPNNTQIQIRVTLGYNDSVNSSVCDTVFNKFNNGRIRQGIERMCNSCMISQPTDDTGDCKDNEHGYNRRCTFGVLVEYIENNTIGYYDSMWVNITTILNQTIGPLKNIPGRTLNYTDYSPWTAACDSIAYSVPTILSLHGVVNCRGCYESYYMDPCTKDRCLQCPFGYWTRGLTRDGSQRQDGSQTEEVRHYNSYKNCVECPSTNKVENRTAFLQLCYYRH